MLPVVSSLVPSPLGAVAGTERLEQARRPLAKRFSAILRSRRTPADEALGARGAAEAGRARFGGGLEIDPRTFCRAVRRTVHALAIVDGFRRGVPRCGMQLGVLGELPPSRRLAASRRRGGDGSRRR